MSVKQPITQVRLTNIVVVRYRTKGNRYEIACFPNKVLDWRKKIEKNIMNVIQSDAIFKNVSKGQLASTKELAEDFGTTDTMEVCQIILEKGQLQVSERERVQDLSNKLKEVVVLVAGMCVNSETKQPVPVRTIENAATQLKFAVKMNVPAKLQALKLFRELAEVLPIERVKMRVLVVAPTSMSKTCKAVVVSHATTMVSVNASAHDVEYTVLMDPGAYRPMCDELADSCGGQCEVTILETHADADDEMGMEMEEEEEEEEVEAVVEPKKEKTKKKKNKGDAAAEELQRAMQQLSLKEEEEEALPRRKAAKKKGKKKTESEEEEEAAMALLRALPNQRRRNRYEDDSDEEEPVAKPTKGKGKGKQVSSGGDGKVATDSEEEEQFSTSSAPSAPMFGAAVERVTALNTQANAEVGVNTCGHEGCTSVCACDVWGSTDDDIDSIVNRSAQPVVLREEDVVSGAVLINKRTGTTLGGAAAESGARISKTRKSHDDDSDDDIMAILNKFDGKKAQVLREEGQVGVRILSQQREAPRTATVAPTPGLAANGHEMESDDEDVPSVYVEGHECVFMREDDDDYDDDLPVFVADVETIAAVQRAHVRRGGAEEEYESEGDE